VTHGGKNRNAWTQACVLVTLLPPQIPQGPPPLGQNPASNGMSSNLGQDTGYPEVFFFLPPLEKCRPLTIPPTSTGVTVKQSCASHTDVLGGMDVRSHLFLTSALDVVNGQRYVPATLARYPLTRRLGGPNIRSERFGRICISVPDRN